LSAALFFHCTPFFGLLVVTYAFFWVVAPLRWPRLLVLLISSLVFYAAWKPTPLLVFAGIGFVNWVGGHWIERTRWWATRRLIAGIVVALHLSTLIAYKYLDLFLTSFGSLATKLELELPFPVPKSPGLLLPIGLSFVCFKAISFIVDVYRRQTSGRRSYVHQLVYLIYFPSLVAGPILRSGDLLDKLDARPQLNSEEGARGLMRIAQGVAKKLLLADLLAGALVDPVFSNPGNYSGLECALATVAYTFQIYFDFSGYSDIAVGVCALFGFEVPENFNKPYHATNLFEFWNRWHMTLSTWLRDYLYRPLGGNQAGKWTTLRNTLLVMSLGGLWHGADWRFLVWGGLHGVLLVIWRIWWWTAGKPKKGQASFARNFAGWFLMFNAVVFLRIFFRADSMDLALAMFRQLGTFTYDLARVSTLAWGSLAACIIFYAMPKPVFEKSNLLFLKSPALVRAAALIGLGLIIRQLSSVEAQPYIYFQY
jgi:D-alanyl-lipoteichoic acid acyltransferase DltB (MBOAT superfamily)